MWGCAQRGSGALAGERLARARGAFSGAGLLMALLSAVAVLLGCASSASAAVSRYALRGEVAADPEGTTFLMADGALLLAGGSYGLQISAPWTTIPPEWSPSPSGSASYGQGHFGSTFLRGYTITDGVPLDYNEKFGLAEDIEVFGYREHVGKAWIFGAQSGWLDKEVEIGPGPVTFTGAVSIGADVYVVDPLNKGVWESTNDGLSFHFVALPGETAAAEGLVVSGSRLLLLQGSGGLSYNLHLEEPHPFSVSGAGALRGGAAVDEEGDAVLVSGSEAFQVDAAQGEPADLTSPPLSGLGLPTAFGGAEQVPGRCVLVPSWSGEIYIFGPTAALGTGCTAACIGTCDEPPPPFHIETPPPYLVPARAPSNSASEVKSGSTPVSHRPQKRADARRRCRVPHLRRVSLKVARLRARKHDCRLGQIRRPRRKRHRLVVVRQAPKPGNHLRARTRINIRLGRPTSSRRHARHHGAHSARQRTSDAGN